MAMVLKEIYAARENEQNLNEKPAFQADSAHFLFEASRVRGRNRELKDTYFFNTLSDKPWYTVICCTRYKPAF